MRIQYVGAKNIVSTTFGKANKSHTKELDVVRPKVRYTNRFIFINALCSFFFKSPFRKQRFNLVKKYYKHILIYNYQTQMVSHLHLQWAFQLELNFMIRGKTIRGSLGPVATSTVLGLVLK